MLQSTKKSLINAGGAAAGMGANIVVPGSGMLVNAGARLISGALPQDEAVEKTLYNHPQYRPGSGYETGGLPKMSKQTDYQMPQGQSWEKGLSGGLDIAGMIMPIVTGMGVGKPAAEEGMAVPESAPTHEEGGLDVEVEGGEVIFNEEQQAYIEAGETDEEKGRRYLEVKEMLQSRQGENQGIAQQGLYVDRNQRPRMNYPHPDSIPSSYVPPLPGYGDFFKYSQPQTQSDPVTSVPPVTVPTGSPQQSQPLSLSPTNQPGYDINLPGSLIPGNTPRFLPGVTVRGEAIRPEPVVESLPVETLPAETTLPAVIPPTTESPIISAPSNYTSILGDQTKQVQFPGDLVYRNRPAYKPRSLFPNEIVPGTRQPAATGQEAAIPDGPPTYDYDSLLADQENKKDPDAASGLSDYFNDAINAQNKSNLFGNASDISKALMHMSSLLNNRGISKPFRSPDMQAPTYSDISHIMREQLNKAMGVSNSLAAGMTPQERIANLGNATTGLMQGELQIAENASRTQNMNKEAFAQTANKNIEKNMVEDRDNYERVMKENMLDHTSKNASIQGLYAAIDSAITRGGQSEQNIATLKMLKDIMPKLDPSKQAEFFALLMG